MTARSVAVALVALPSLVAAPARAQDVHVAWIGEAPRQGSFAYVEAGTVPAAVAVRGTVDGLPLAFVDGSAGRFAALAMVKLGAADSVPVDLVIEYAKGRTHRHRAWLRVVRADFPSERLTVDPRFSRPPDSALQVRLARERELSAAVTRQALAAPRLWTEDFVAPRATRVTSVFGVGRVFNGELQSRHLGTDFEGAVGDPVRAANRGVVALAGDFYYAGRLVYVNHGAGLVTAYLHLDEVLVREGDTVARGQVIGRVGRSGRVTGPHLHWAARVGSSLADGMSLLTLQSVERLFAR